MAVLVMQISVRMPIIAGFWAFNYEHDIVHAGLSMKLVLCSQSLGIVYRFVGSFFCTQ